MANILIPLVVMLAGTCGEVFPTQRDMLYGVSPRGVPAINARSISSEPVHIGVRPPNITKHDVGYNWVTEHYIGRGTEGAWFIPRQVQFGPNVHDLG